MKSARKPAKRRTKEESKSAAQIRAEQLRARLDSARKIQPGSITGKEPGWSYAFVPKDAPERVKDIARSDFELKGYELCTSPGVAVAGIPDAEIWQIPTEIAREIRKIRTQEIRSRDRANMRSNII